MKYKAKSIIVSRLKREPDSEYASRPCRITLYSRNDPHLRDEEPENVLEFNKVQKVVLKNLEVNYLLAGNDLVVNDLEEISVSKENGDIVIGPIFKKGLEIGE